MWKSQVQLKVGKKKQTEVFVFRWKGTMNLTSCILRIIKNIDIKHKNNVEEPGAFESR